MEAFVEREQKGQTRAYFLAENLEGMIYEAARNARDT